MSAVPKVAMGSQGLVCSAQGIGAMTMTAFYGDFSRIETEESSIATIGAALEAGVNMIDTAWIYQSFGKGGHENVTNEELVGKALARFGREKFVVATKFGIVAGASGMSYSGTEETIRSQVADSLARLKIDCIDLYYMHRMDPSTPIEETMAVLKALIDEGKIKYIGLSECTPSELRRAHAVHPVTAIQMEWSLQTRNIEDTLLPVARELGVAIVAYSPLGRGFLSKTFDSREGLDAGDWRLANPRFSEESIEANAKAREAFFAIAESKGVTPAQLALAWLHAQGSDVFPIPGTRHAERAVENAGAYALSQALTKEEVQAIGDSVAPFVGDRYPGGMGSSTFEYRL